MKQAKYLLIIFLISISFKSFARYATYDDADSEIEFNQSIIDVKKTGETVIKNKTIVKILNESGRSKYGSITLYFDKDISEIEVLEAKTINKDKIININKNDIEIKPLASSENGFDQKYQILISFPRLIVGSKILLKYKEKILKPVIDNNFFTHLTFGRDGYLSHSNIKINSDIKDLKLRVNDPNNELIIDEKDKKKQKIISIKLKKPVFYKLINEPYSNNIDERKTPYVEISSITSFKELANEFQTKYNKVINSTLPEKFKKILDEAKLITNEYDQIDFITSSISNSIRYMGSWQSIEGKFYPRNLDVISTTGYADCKEYSSLTASILNKLGYKAYASLVFRGYQYIDRFDPLPTPYLYNHAIIYVETPKGKKLWIDPTNFVSISRGIFPDITSRNSLILSDVNPRIEFIPEISPKNSTINISGDISFTDKTIIKNLKILLSGEQAISLSGTELKTSKKSIKEMILNFATGNIRPISYNVQLPNLKSRLVKDLLFKIKFEYDDNKLITNLGSALVIKSLNEEWLNAFTSIKDDHKGIIYLSDPYTLNRKITVKNYKVSSLDNLNYEINNNWFKAKRECTQNNKDVIINESIELTHGKIYPEDSKDKNFQNIANFIKKRMQDTVIIAD